MNYRVNIFGFIAMKELEDENGKSGNYGYYDQLTLVLYNTCCKINVKKQV